MNKRVMIILLAIVLVVAAAFGGYFYWQEKSVADGKIIPGVKIAGVDVGGLTAGEAVDLLKEKEVDFLSNTVKLKYNNKYWSLPHSTMATTDLQKLVNKAASLGRGKGIFANYKEMQAAKEGDFDYQFKMIPQKEKIKNSVSKIKLNLDSKPVDPKVTVSADNKVTITQPKEGVGLDIEQTSTLILEALKPYDSSTVEAKVYSINPRFTAEDIKKWQYNGFISTFTTAFNPLNKERTMNVKVAAQAIDKIVIYPGDEFSFNKIVGPRSKEAGYKEALVIQNNVFTPGLGGGVCQVSSTLYNNLLKSNIKIVERRRHSLPVGYVSPGLDATVAYGFIDLKFKNNYDFPVIIRTSISSNKLFIGLLGDKSKIPQVSVSSKIDKVILPTGSRTVYDSNLPKGKKVVDEPKKGYKVSVYKTVITGAGKNTVKISTDTYPATPQTIRIGTNTKTVWRETYGQAR